MPAWFVRVRTLFRRARMERELDAELRFHLDMQAAEYERQGMSPERARAAARLLFGGVERVKDEVRDTWLTRVVETLAQDARHSTRSLRQNRGYAAAVIATMALGIGANSAIFSVVNAVVLQPLPYARGSDLLLLRQPHAGLNDSGFSIADLDDVKRLSTSLDAVVEYHNMYFILLGGQEPERVATGVVSWDYFQTLGVAPLLGRTFTADDDQPGAPATLVVSHQYWRRVLGADPAVIGRVFEMNDRPHVVVGVLPDVPMFPQPNDVYMPRSACPFRMKPELGANRGGGMASALGRRRPGARLKDAQADLANVAAHLQHAHPDAYRAAAGHHLAATPLRREFTRSFESTLIVLLSTSGFVLLIVCASVANLAVARTMRRAHELTLRTALGASRARLTRQLLTESVLLALAGGLAGLVVTFIVTDLLVAYVERFTTRASEIRIDGRVLLFTLGVSIATGLASGTLPLLSRRLGFRRGAAATIAPLSPTRRDLRRTLIVAQIAASFMLLIGAGLMVRSLMKLTGVNPGFSSDHVLTMQLDMNFSKYREDPERAAYHDRLMTRLKAVPDVSSVGAAGTIPFLERAGSAFGRFTIEGQGAAEDPDRPRASVLFASEDYFRTIDVPLLRGRFFSRTDDLDGPRVVIVNQSLADRYWPDGDPVGQRISGNGRDWVTIVGVVANLRQQLSLDPVDEIYSPLRQAPYVTTNWVLRSARNPAELAPLVRAAVHEVDRDQPIYRMRPLDEVRAASLAPPRLTATLLGLFAVLALLITATGIAGVIAFSVTQRTQEFGVRVALGARRTDVVSMVVGEGLRLALSGLAVGAAGALLLGGLLSTMLFRVEPTDAVTYAAVSCVLVAVAALACLVPALRAASVDPIRALRTT
jgi:putative ABC transport system permease protein